MVFEDTSVSMKNLFMIITCVIFLVFFLNVVAGAAGLGVFLSDVGEMLTLLAACVCFVVAMLAYERSATDDRTHTADDETPGGTDR